MKNRILGFDLARSYAIFGMIIVNLNMVFGDYTDPSFPGKILAMFAGNSSTVFIILAGMGVAMVSQKRQHYSEERQEFKTEILKKALFLFVFGLLLSLWWPADILHMYGCYMAIASMMLYINPKYYLMLALFVVVVFHVFTFLIPYETGWNFKNFAYLDFYTVEGFLRNTFYNGWNPVFPWMAYFLIGLYLGRLDWQDRKVHQKFFGIGLIGYLSIIILEFLSLRLNFSEGWMRFIHADYLPPMLPFFISTASFSLILISLFMFIGEKVNQSQWAKNLSLVGQMTFTHYVAHLTIGILLLSWITGKPYDENILLEQPNSPIFIFTFCMLYFLGSFGFSVWWSQYFKKGPLETLMRKFSDSPRKKVLAGTT